MHAQLTTQLHHRTVRRFTTEALTPETISELITVAQHTATSHFLQSFSVISITDAKLRQQIAGISHQSYVDANGQLFVFVLDQYRAAKLSQLVDPSELGSADKFLQGASDTILAAQNMVNAAENLGLGTVVLGSILNDAKQLIALLHLPRYTFPILGLIVGHPGQKTRPKPRMPQSMMHFDNGYDTQQAVGEIAEYDQVIRTYYANRATNAREETFTELLTKSASTSPAKRGELLDALHQQGFLEK